MIDRILTNCVTINVDASYDHEYKVGGYAFTICFEKRRYRSKGIIEIDKCKSPEEAEMFGIWQAIAYLQQMNPLPLSKWFIINCDCKGAMRRIESPAQVDKAGQIINRIYISTINILSSSRNEFRHVKGHTNNRMARNRANNWCDITARDEMRKYRAFIKKRINIGKSI